MADLQSNLNRIYRIQGLDLERNALLRDQTPVSPAGTGAELESALLQPPQPAASARLAAIQSERTALATKTVPNYLTLFTRIAGARGGVGIVKLMKGACGGCHRVLPLQFVNIARQNMALHQCLHCARILYVHEDSGVIPT